MHDHTCTAACIPPTFRYQVVPAQLREGDVTEWGPVTGAPDIWPNGRVYVPIAGAGPNDMRGFDPAEELLVQRPEHELVPGARVKFLADKLGVLLHQDDGQFVGTLGCDFVGEFVGPHPSDRLAGWFLVSVAPRTVEPGNDGCAELIRQAERDDARLFVPVHGSQIAPCG